MLETKDFATGCVTILLCLVLIPLFLLVLKVTLTLAILLAAVTAVILGVTVIGRLVRLFLTGK